VEAFVSLHRSFPQARLLLVGPRHDLARPDLAGFHQRLQEMVGGAGDQVIFTGPVSDVQPYLQAADLLVFPSRREGMPNVVPEAMASGLPVVMTPFIGLPVEFGKAGEQYLLSSWEPADLAQNIRCLLEDEALRDALGRAARDWVARHLDLEQSLDAYMDLYCSPGRGRKRNA
jgi:glycosyltransferase involved in cell wall biosynthesis